jgi:hypothetical protein
MDLHRATALAKDLRDLLAAEVERARGERQLLRTLDADALFRRVSLRKEFNLEAHRLQREIASAIEAAAMRLRLREPSIEAIAAAVPGPGAELRSVVDDVKGLAAALAELDELNCYLATRTLFCVRGYVSAMVPQSIAYDRQGTAHAAVGTASVSRRA